MNLKFCSCRACKRGRGNKYSKYITNSRKKAARHSTKAQLKNAVKNNEWDVDLPTSISIPYTD